MSHSEKSSTGKYHGKGGGGRGNGNSLCDESSEFSCGGKQAGAYGGCPRLPGQPQQCDCKAPASSCPSVFPKCPSTEDSSDSPCSNTVYRNVCDSSSSTCSPSACPRKESCKDSKPFGGSYSMGGEGCSSSDSSDSSDSCKKCSSSSSSCTPSCSSQSSCKSSSSSCKKCSSSSSSSSSCKKCSSSSSSSCSSSSSSSCSKSSSSSSSSCSKSSSSSSSSSDCENKFEITLVDRKHHPHFNRIVDIDKCFAINGKAGATLHLKRGRRYGFIIKQDLNVNYPQPFFFTADLAGGQAGDACADNWAPLELAGTHKAATDGVVYLDTKKLPPHFYYQSKNAKFLGGMVFVHDR